MAGLAFPGQAFGCWDVCTAKYGGVFGANGTVYELTGCSQTWPDGYHDPVTVCYYTNIYRPTNRM
jgi:hypothetical protein